MCVGVLVARMEDDRPIMQDLTTGAGPVTLTYPQDIQAVPFHLTEDLCCLGGLNHGSDVPCSNADLGFRP